CGRPPGEERLHGEAGLPLPIRHWPPCQQHSVLHCCVGIRYHFDRHHLEPVSSWQGDAQAMAGEGRGRVTLS
ncbi:hypothetical protein CRUP_007295, partial [Coryphaenoides rupestris]